MYSGLWNFEPCLHKANFVFCFVFGCQNVNSWSFLRRTIPCWPKKTQFCASISIFAVLWPIDTLRMRIDVIQLHWCITNVMLKAVDDSTYFSVFSSNNLGYWSKQNQSVRVCWRTWSADGRLRIRWCNGLWLLGRHQWC